MDITTIEKRARSEAINRTISLVDEALNLNLEFPPYATTPSDRREIMIARLVAEREGATDKIAMLEREVADLRVAAAAKQEDFIGWGSPVILKRAKKSPARVEWLVGGNQRG